jgi:uncharacterized membrane protein
VNVNARSTGRLHPLHPALAHFPLAFWVGCSASDLIALTGADPSWWRVSYCAAAAGTLMGAVTLLAGLLELWLRQLPRAAVPWVIAHATLMGSALLCFMVSLAWRTASPPAGSALALSFIGSAIVLVGGYCGGTLVYRFGVGVAWRPENGREKTPL